MSLVYPSYSVSPPPRQLPSVDARTARGSPMLQLFAGPTQDFVDRMMQNRIARDLKDACFSFHGFNPSPREERSWSNSLDALSNAILLEYQLPLSSRRLDAMITDLRHDGDPAAVTVELQQWTDCEPLTVDKCVTVRNGGRTRDVLTRER